MTIKRILIIISMLFASSSVFAQDKSGYYYNWNIDHTERYVKPSIPLTKLEANKISSYLVEFNKQNYMTSVSYFFEGKPSIHSNFNAFKMVREHSPNQFIEKFMDNKGQFVLNNDGVYKRVYKLNDSGFWIEKMNYDRKGQLIEVNEVARVVVERDEQGAVVSEVQYNIKGGVIPDGNGFSYVHFKYNADGLTTHRENRNREGNLVNGKFGYATVYFQFDAKGSFFEEEFRDALGHLIVHPYFDLAKIHFRELNKYGKPSRIYYINENGYPHKERAYAVVTHRPNMTRESITYFDHVGDRTSDRNGVYSSTYEYDIKGKYLGKTHYDITGKEITAK